MSQSNTRPKTMLRHIATVVALLGGVAALPTAPHLNGTGQFWIGPKPKNGCYKFGTPENAVGKDSSIWVACETGICCYHDPTTELNLGCFENGPTTLWCHQGSLPDSPDAISPQMWFYGADGVEQDIDYRSLGLSVANLRMDSTKQLFVLVHGFGGEWPKTYMFPQRDALLREGNNVVIVRWTKGSAGPDYPKAVANTRVMGVLIARMLETMMDKARLDLKKTHLVGFSLGAHVMGYAGAQLKYDGRKGLRRIIGVDPAGPLYANNDPMPVNPSTRLNPSDADFVQCMHGNGELLTHGGAGTMQAFGDVDFYANGGQVQPGCAPGLKSSNLTCSHDRNTWLFTSSVILADPRSSGCKFDGIRCASTKDWDAGNCFDACPPGGCPSAGYETDLGTTAKGSYFYATRGDNATDSDFCGRVWRITIVVENTAVGHIVIVAKGNGLTSSPYLFQRKGDKLLQGISKRKIMVWDYGIWDLEELDLLYTADSDKDNQEIKLSLVSIEEHGSTCSYTGNQKFMAKSGLSYTIPLSKNSC